MLRRALKTRRLPQCSSAGLNPHCRTGRAAAALTACGALSVGTEIIRLRRICRRFDLGSHLYAALETMARGDSAMTIVRLTRLDEALNSADGSQHAFRVRGEQ